MFMKGMDSETKEYYRNKIQELSKKTKISEMYIAKKILELATKSQNENQNGAEKKSHIGYYLIDDGIYELQKVLKCNKKNTFKARKQIKIIYSNNFCSNSFNIYRTNCYVKYKKYISIFSNIYFIINTII